LEKTVKTTAVVYCPLNKLLSVLKFTKKLLDFTLYTKVLFKISFENVLLYFVQELNQL